MSYFYFNNISSDVYGLKIISMPPPSRSGNETESITVPGRPEPLNRSKPEYENTELEFEFLITDISKTRKIFAWLKGSGKLVYSDEPDKYYNVISNDIIDAVRVSDELRSFTVRFTCSPFAYSVENSPETHSNILDDETRSITLTVNNGGSIFCEPLYKIELAGKLTMKVNDADDPLIIKIPGEYTTAKYQDGVYAYKCEKTTIYIDSAAKAAYKIESGVKKVVCDMTKGKFPMLAAGENTIELSLSPKTETFRNYYIAESGDAATAEIRTYRYNSQSLAVFDITKNERWL